MLTALRLQAAFADVLTERTNLNCFIVMKAFTLGLDGKSPTSVCEGNLGSAELKMLSDCVKPKLLLSVNCCACAIGFHEIKKAFGQGGCQFSR